MLSYYNHGLSVCGVRDLCYNYGRRQKRLLTPQQFSLRFFITTQQADRLYEFEEVS